MVFDIKTIKWYEVCIAMIRNGLHNQIDYWTANMCLMRLINHIWYAKVEFLGKNLRHVCTQIDSFSPYIVLILYIFWYGLDLKVLCNRHKQYF